MAPTMSKSPIGRHKAKRPMNACDAIGSVACSGVRVDLDQDNRQDRVWMCNRSGPSPRGSGTARRRRGDRCTTPTPSACGVAAHVCSAATLPTSPTSFRKPSWPRRVPPSTYDPSRGSLWVWLWGIARRHVALHFRKEQRHDRLRQAEAWLAGRNGELFADGASAPPALLESAELATLVRATLTELPADYESLLTAKYLDGDSVETIATQEQSTSTAVRSKLARARQAFRQAFEKWSVVSGQ